MLERVFYIVDMLINGEWQLWTRYDAYKDAALAAGGLINKPHVTATRVLEIRKNGGRVLTELIKDASGHVAAKQF